MNEIPEKTCILYIIWETYYPENSKISEHELLKISCLQQRGSKSYIFVQVFSFQIKLLVFLSMDMFANNKNAKKSQINQYNEDQCRQNKFNKVRSLFGFVNLQINTNEQVKYFLMMTKNLFIIFPSLPYYYIILFSSSSLSLQQQRHNQNIIIKMRILQQFDRNPIQIGFNKKYATVCGIVLGILTTLLLVFIAVVKISSVFRYEVLYLNYWRNQEMDGLKLKDMEFRLTLFTSVSVEGRQGQWVPIGVENASLVGVTVKICFQEHNQGKIMSKVQYDLVMCSNLDSIQEQQKEYHFCFPEGIQPQIFGNYHDIKGHYKTSYIKVQAKYHKLSNLFNFTKNYFHKSNLSHSYNKNQGQQSLVGKMVYRFAQKSVDPYNHDNPLFTQSFKQQKLEGLFSAELSANVSTFLHFSSTNLTTDNNVFPVSFDSLKQFDQYWRYQSQYNEIIKKANPSKPLYFYIMFNRAPFTSIYQRKYKRIDTALAQVLALSTIVGILLKLLFMNYNKWASRQYLIEEVEGRSFGTGLIQQQQEQKNKQSILTENNKSQANFVSFAKSTIKKPKNQIQLQQLQKKKKMEKQIEQSGELLSLYITRKKFEQSQQKLKIIQKILFKDPNFYKIYKEQIYKLKGNNNEDRPQSQDQAITNIVSAVKNQQENKEEGPKKLNNSFGQKDLLEEELIQKI